MTAAWVQTKTAQAGSATSVGVTLASNPAAGGHLVAATFAWQASAPTITAATGGGTWSATPALAQFSDTSNDSLRVDYCESATGGATTVTCHTNAAAFINGQVSESSGVATSASIGGVNHVSGSGSTTTQTTGSITPAAGSILYTFVMSGGANTAAMGNPTATNNTPATVRSDAAGWDGSTTIRAGTASRDNATAAATNYTWSESSGSAVMSAAIVEFLQASGGGGGGGIPFFMQDDLLSGDLQTLHGNMQ